MRRAISGRPYPWGADVALLPGQRQPHAPVAPQSARLWNHNAAAVEDPGEVYGGYNGVTRATTEVCPARYCSPHHLRILNPRLLKYMASYDVASSVRRALH